jgi:hypothetical protein
MSGALTRAAPGQVVAFDAKLTSSMTIALEKAIAHPWSRQNLKKNSTLLEERPMHVENSQSTSAAGIGVLIGLGIIGVAIILALVYALW